MLKILKDTRDYYAEDPVNRRSVDKDGNCNYTWGDNHCAVGRYLKTKYQHDHWTSNNDSIKQLMEEDTFAGFSNIDWALREEVQGLDTDFWTNLQVFHDNRHNWELKNMVIDQGLSIQGKESYNKIQTEITGGSYDG